MSDSTGPVRRRRIAGESKPAAPAPKKPLSRKVPARKAAAKKAVTPKAPAPPTKVPATKAVATAKIARPSKTSSPTAAPSVSPERDASGDSSERLALRWLVPGVLVAVAALVAGIFLTVAGVRHLTGGGGDDLDASREQASSAAGSAAETIFSFRYDQLDKHLTASKALMTKSFAKDFDKIAPALTELAPQRKIVVEAVARDAAALPCGDECSPKKANVLVFVDQARLVGSSKTPTVFANRISVSMVKTDQGWLVNNIRAL